MDIDEVFTKTGEFGRFQWKAFIGVMLANMFMGTEMVQNIFAGAIPAKLSCASEDSLQACHKNCTNVAFPEDNFTSFATEWKMVCPPQVATVQTTQSIYMAGVMTGSFFMGGLGDKFGRLPVLLTALGSCSLFGLLSSFPKVWVLYASLRFFTGFFLSGVIIVGFVLTSELVGPSKRGIIGTMPSCGFTLGICLLTVTAWATQNWRWMSVVLATIGIILTPASYCLYLESPRWHLAKGNVEKCQTVLRKIARTNGHDLGEINLKVVKQSESASMTSLFRDKILRKITLIQISTWFTASAVYYGLTIASGDMGSNRYVSVILSAIVELPANILIMFVMNMPRCGRVRSCTVSMIASSIFCGSIWFIDEEKESAKMVVVVLACIGKFFMVMAFSIIYVQAGELYPTSVRNVGLGMVSVSTRVGGIMAPQIVNLNNLYHNSHFIVFGILGCVSGVLCLLLPETLGRPLPDVPEDIYRNIKKMDSSIVSVKDGDRMKLLSDLDDEEEEILMETKA